MSYLPARSVPSSSQQASSAREALYTDSLFPAAQLPVLSSLSACCGRGRGLMYGVLILLIGMIPSLVEAQCPAVQATLSTAGSTVCSGQKVAIPLQVSVNPVTSGSFSGRFTNDSSFTGLVPVAGVLRPEYTFLNTGSAIVSKTFQLAALSFTDASSGATCPVAAGDLSGTTVISVLPLPDLDASLTSLPVRCSGSSVAITVTNPNGVGGTYNRQATYNGAGHTASATATGQAYGSFADTLTNATSSALTVRYLFTPVNGDCTGVPDTVYVTVNPKPTISCPANTIQNTDAGACAAVVTGIDPLSYTAATCNGAAPVLSYVLTGATSGTGTGTASGATFNKGITTVTYYIMDGGGNKDSCRFTVTVKDAQAPAFTICPTAITATADPTTCGAIVSYTATATDNCLGVVALTYSHVSGSVFPVGTTPVTITAKDSAGNTALCTFSVTVTNPAIYVNDTSRTGDVYTTVAGNDLMGNGTRCAPFATVQKAITAALPGSTVYVDAGTYREDVVLNKQLTLKGANYGVNPNGSGPFNKPSLVQPATSSPVNGSAILYLEPAAGGSIVDGFTFDGNNNTITSGVVINGADIDAAEGIGAYAGIANTTISNNIIRNLNYAGIDFDNFYTNSVATSGNLITSNRFTNIFPAQYGAGIAIADNCYTGITNNRMDSVRLGIQASKFFQADPGTSHNISGNTITSSRTGIWYYFTYASGTGFDITGNALNTYADATNNNGILVDSVLGTTGVAISGNTITGAYAGINLYNNPTSSSITIGANTISGGSYGIFANNYDGLGTSATEASTYLVKGTTIENAGIAGIYVKDNGAGSHVAVSVQVSDSTVIRNAATGIKIEGSAASIAFTGSKPALLKGQAVFIDQLSNGSSLPATTIDATRVLFDSTTGAAATQAQNFRIEDKIRHRTDSTGMGFVLVKSGNAYVTPNSHIAPTAVASVQRVVDAVTTGFVVNVDSGNFKEDIVISKKLSLLGSGYAKTTFTGSKGGNTSTVQVVASGVVLDGLKITREGNNPTDWNSTDLNKNGIYIQGQASDAEVRNCWVQGNYNGINISNSNSNNLHDNLIENNWNGLLFSNQADSTLAQENIVRANFSYGFLFADSSNGTNSTPQSAVQSNFNRNSIYGNWYGDVVDRQLLANGSNAKDFGCNWYGLPSEPVVGSVVTEPAYNTQVPALFGGTATAPASRSAVISGAAAANIKYTSWLVNGTDTAATIPGFQPVADACKGLLHFNSLAADAQLCSANGAIRFVFQGGKAPYSLSYTGAATGTAAGIRSTDTIRNLVAGVYAFTITDSSGYVGVIDTVVVKYHPVTNTVSKNSFATLQAAMSAAAGGDTLQVCRGSYKEELVVNKKLTLLGPNAAVAGGGTRVNEAILYPARVDYNYTNGHASILKIVADSVTVKGFTFNGDNPDSTAGLAVNGATVEAAEAIATATAKRQLHIENNVFKNFAGAAVALLPAADTALSGGNTITGNRFANIDNPGTGAYGTGIRLGNNLYAAVENNHMDTVGVGIRSDNYSLTDANTPAYAIAGNTIVSRVAGIWHTRTATNATAFALRRNRLTAAAGATQNTGILLSGLQSTAITAIQQDTVRNSRYGIRLVNNAAGSLSKIGGSVMTNCDTALLAANADTGTTAIAGTYVLDSATITGGNMGLVVKDNKEVVTNGATVTVTVQGNTHISNTLTGVQVSGSRAGIAFTSPSPATFNGQAKYIDLTSNGATVPAGAVDATAVQFDGLTGATATAAQNFAIEDKISHRIDSAALGFVLVKAKHDFVTVSSHLSPGTTARIQRGVLAADTGFTVNVAPGIFTDNIIINKRLSLQGAGVDSTKINSLATGGNIITIAADSVAVSNLYLEGTPDLVTNLSTTRGVYFNSPAQKTTLTNLKASLHQYSVFIDNAANVVGLAVSGAAFSNGGNGLGVAVSGKLTDLSVSNTAFDNNLYALTSNADTATGSSNLNGLNGVSVTNCTFTGNTVKGIYFEKAGNTVISNNTFTNNGLTATGAGLELNLKNGVYSNVLISNNKLTNNGYAPGNGSAIAVKARNDAPAYAASPASLSNVQVVNNEITTAPVGISIGYNVARNTTRIDSNKIVATNGIVSYAAATGAITQIHSNSIIAAQFALVNGDTAAGSGKINATCNWLSSTDPAVVAGKISGPATYVPYLPVSTDNQLVITGFQPAAACATCTTLMAAQVKTNPICNGGASGSITATASGGAAPYLYTISPMPATMIQPEAGRFTGLPAGIYTVTGYGADGCSTSFRADTIMQPTAAISYSSALYCTSITSAVPTLTGTESYQGGAYSSSTGLALNSNSGEINPSASTPGNYTVTYTKQPALGCGLMSTSAVITIRAAPNAGALSGSQAICVGGNTTIASNGTGGGVFTSSNTTAATVDSLSGVVKGISAGTAVITYTVTGGGGCDNGAATYGVTINAAPQGSISNAVTATQSNATTSPVTFTGSGGTAPYTFTYSVNGGAVKTISTTATSNSITINQSNAVVGTYTYSLLSTTAAAGCSSTNATPATAAVTVTDAPPVDLSVTIPRPINSGFVANQQKEGYIQIDNISANPTTGQVVFRVPKTANFTLSIPANMTTVGSTAVNNSDWTITEGPISYRITSNKATALNANSSIRIGFRLTATGPANTSGSTTIVILDNTGGISTAAGDSNSTNNQSIIAFTIN